MQRPTETHIAIILSICTVLSVAAFPGTPRANAADHDIDVIIVKIDQLFRAESSRATLQMQIVTPDWERTLSGIASWTVGSRER